MPVGKPSKLSKAVTIKLATGNELAIIDQPAGRSAFVSEQPDTLTSFRAASKNGVYGFLAHNFLAGQKFSNLKIGQRVTINDDKGRQRRYKIKKVDKFQALDPKNPRGDFLNLKSDQVLSAKALFEYIYTGGHHLVLQTCISKDGNDEWGRMFISAEPEKLRNRAA